MNIVDFNLHISIGLMCLINILIKFRNFKYLYPLVVYSHRVKGIVSAVFPQV